MTNQPLIEVSFKVVLDEDTRNVPKRYCKCNYCSDFINEFSRRDFYKSDFKYYIQKYLLLKNTSIEDIFSGFNIDPNKLLDLRRELCFQERLWYYGYSHFQYVYITKHLRTFTLSSSSLFDKMKQSIPDKGKDDNDIYSLLFEDNSSDLGSLSMSMSLPSVKWLPPGLYDALASDSSYDDKEDDCPDLERYYMSEYGVKDPKEILGLKSDEDLCDEDDMPDLVDSRVFEGKELISSNRNERKAKYFLCSTLKVLYKPTNRYGKLFPVSGTKKRKGKFMNFLQKQMLFAENIFTLISVPLSVGLGLLWKSFKKKANFKKYFQIGWKII